MYRLVISDDAGKTTVVMLVRDEITIGRAEENHICLTERNVSRRHARIVRHEGGFAIQDLGSYNGVKVNGIRIEGAVQLTPGDRVAIGDYQLRYESEATASLSGDVDEVSIETQLPARLVMLNAPAPGAEFALARLPVRLGRSEDIQITVNHRSISREHAEFREVDGSVVIKDLASANGVRVNGEDVEEATLQDGDVLEFGQVRFRFVGPGVEFAFDPNAPEVAEEEESAASPKAPSVAAVLIIAVAVAIAAAIAMKGARERQSEGEVAPAATAAQGGDTASQLAAAVRGCEDALRAGRYEEALRSAERAVSLDANASAAHDCRARANAGANASTLVSSSIELFRGGDVVRAYRELEQIPAGHEALTRSEVRDVARAYVDLKSSEAEAALRANNGSAAALAATEAVAAVDAFALDDLRPAAAQLLERARGASTGAAAQPAPGAAAPQAAPGDMAAAQACLRDNNVDCVLAATEGQETLLALDLRFRALSRARGRRSDALRAARTLVQRFPSSPAAARAREYLQPAATP